MRTRHTAWIHTTPDTTDPDGYATVQVIPDTIVGELDGGPVWAPTDADPVFYVITPYRGEDLDDDKVLEYAGRRLAAADWKTTTEWEPVPSGYVATVEHPDH